MSGIVLPQQLSASVENIPGPNAFPLSLMMQQPGQIKWLAVGGISKRLLVAAQIASGLPGSDDASWEREAFELADRLIAHEEKQAAT